ncbi:hypothetical protein [Terrimonas alba]|uniref:hypothetical protein n=1 Tax=Terrimonas alba TaxID=3349636 RepID=UPI0035F3EE33
MLIIWNKLFSTLCTKKKDLQIVYGLTKPLNSHSFFRQHFHLPPEIYNELSYTKGVKAKWKVLSGKPDDLDPRFRSILERKLLNVARLYRPSTPAMRQYVTVQTIFPQYYYLL